MLSGVTGSIPFIRFICSCPHSSMFHDDRTSLSTKWLYLFRSVFFDTKQQHFLFSHPRDRLEIRQFHLEMTAGELSRGPDYSLGIYQKTTVVRERGEYWNESARIIKVKGYHLMFNLSIYLSLSLSLSLSRNTHAHPSTIP